MVFLVSTLEKDDVLELLGVVSVLRIGCAREREMNTDKKIPEDNDDKILSFLLHAACEVDAVNCARSLLDSELPVDERDQEGRTALHIAALNLSIKCVRLLIEKNACTNTMSFGNKNYLPLQYALEGVRTQFSADSSVEYLQENLQNNEEVLSVMKLLVEKTQSAGEVAYRYAIEGSVNMVAIMMIISPNVVLDPVTIFVTPTNERTQSIYDFVWDEILSCMDASDSDDLKRRQNLLSILELFYGLIDRLQTDQLNENEKTSSQETHGTKIFAIVKDNPVILLRLITSFRKEAIDFLSKGKVTDWINMEISKRLLHIACKNDASKCTELLLEEGNEILLAVDERDMLSTLLRISADAHSVKCIQFLLLKAAKTDIKLHDDSSRSALLKVALMSSRFQYEWPFDISIEKALSPLKAKNLDALKVLTEKNSQIQALAYDFAIKAEITRLALLLLVAAEKILTKKMCVPVEGKSSTDTFYNLVADKLLSGRSQEFSTDEYSTKWRTILICEIDLLNHFSASSEVPHTSTNMANLVKAAKADDSDILKVLLIGDVNARGASEAVVKDDTDLFTSKVETFRSKANHRADSKTGQILYRELSSILLHVACKCDALNCARILLDGQKGITVAPVDALDHLGWTPLHLAAEKHSSKCIDLLLSKNARTNARIDTRLVKERKLALEVAVSSERVQTSWSLHDPLDKLVSMLKEMDLSSVRSLADKTQETAQVAYSYAMKEHVQALAVLLIAGSKILGPVKIGDNVTEKSVYDAVLDEALLIEGSGLVSKRRKRALCCAVRLLRDAKERELIGNTIKSEHVSLRAKPERLSVLEYVDESRNSLMTETMMPNLKISLEMTPKGYKFAIELTERFFDTSLAKLSWNGAVPWANFVIVDGRIKVTTTAPHRWAVSSFQKDVTSLIEFLMSVFHRPKTHLVSPYPPYLLHFTKVLRELHRYSSADRQLYVTTHLFLMDSNLRLVFIIMLKRWSTGLLKLDPRVSWSQVVEGSQLRTDWFSTLKVIDIFWNVIQRAESRGEGYIVNSKLSAFRLSRDVAVHAPSYGCFEGNHGLELLIAHELGDFIAGIQSSCLMRKMDIKKVLSCVLRCVQCIDKQDQILALLCVDETRSGESQVENKVKPKGMSVASIRNRKSRQRKKRQKEEARAKAMKDQPTPESAKKTSLAGALVRARQLEQALLVEKMEKDSLGTIIQTQQEEIDALKKKLESKQQEIDDLKKRSQESRRSMRKHPMD